MRYLLFGGTLVFIALFIVGCGKSVSLSYSPKSLIFNTDKKIDIQISGDDNQLTSSIMHKIYQAQQAGQNLSFNIGKGGTQIVVSSSIKHYQKPYIKQSEFNLCGKYLITPFEQQKTCIEVVPAIEDCLNFGFVENANVFIDDGDNKVAYSIDGSNSREKCGEPYLPQIRHYNQRGDLTDVLIGHSAHISEDNIDVPTEQISEQIFKILNPDAERYSLYMSTQDEGFSDDEKKKFDAAIVFIQNHQFEAAETKLSLLLLKHNSYSVYFNLGIAHEGDKNFKEAIKYYRLAGEHGISSADTNDAIEAVSRVNIILKKIGINPAPL